MGVFLFPFQKLYSSIKIQILPRLNVYVSCVYGRRKHGPLHNSPVPRQRQLALANAPKIFRPLTVLPERVLGRVRRLPGAAIHLEGVRGM